MSASPSTSTEVSPQQIGKAFVVQYYRLLHEHPESLHRFYSSSSILMHDDPTKTATGLESIIRLIEDLSFKQRHVKIRQVDCNSTVGSAVVVQVCGEISSSAVLENQAPVMKRFVQTFVLAPTANARQKYYVHNDIFRYQDGTTSTSTADQNTSKTFSPNTNEVASFEASSSVQSPITPSSAINIDFTDNATTKKEDEPEPVHSTPPVTTVDEQQKSQTKEQTSKPKSYRDAIGKKEKVPVTNESQSTLVTASSATTVKAPKFVKQKASKATNQNTRAARGHPQDTEEYYDDSWYYGTGEGGYLHTGYTDDQEIFVGNLSAQVTEEEIHRLFHPYGRLLLVRIGNTGSQVGAANFAFVVCQSIDMAKAIVADHDKLLQSQQVNVEAKKRRPFPHTFRPTYPTAASPTNYQSTGYPATYYEHSTTAPFYDGGVAERGRGGAGIGGGRRGGKRGTHEK